jgi:hypothetical protein
LERRDNGLNGPVGVKQIQVTNRAQEVTSEVVVFDGLRECTVGKWKPLFVTLVRRGAAVVLVSSESVRIHAGNTNDISVLEHRVSSWTLEEYSCACADDRFWSTQVAESFDLQADSTLEDRALALEQKFATAGHSARFMFRSQSEAHVAAIIRAAAKSLNSLSAVTEALLFQGNTGAVNLLVAWLYENGPTPVMPSAGLPNPNSIVPPSCWTELRGRADEAPKREAPNCFVSEYTFRTVLASVSTSVDSLRSAAAFTGNRPIEGYALEVHFLAALDKANTGAAYVAVVVDGTVES